MKQFIKWAGFLLTIFLVLVCIHGCKKQDIKTSTTDDVNIVDYMRRYPDMFSEFLKILDRTNISPFLNAYGAYTVFAPTNDAIKIYLQQIGKTSTDELDTAFLKSFSTLHIIQDTLSTGSFTDGKLTTPTMYGQYLITSVNDAGVTVVNRQANVIQPNVYTGNGYIHVIDHVLLPAKQTIAKMLEQNAKYSIFTQALKATGLYDTLNIDNNPDTTRRWLTVLAESDSVLKVAGITSYTDLVKKYSNTGNPKNNSDSLFLYMAYHILPGIKYVADIASATSHPTLAPLQVVTQELSGTTVLLNQATFNGIFEAGIPIDRTGSDNIATNGAWHLIAGDIYLKIRTPVRVDFDIADQPETRKLTSIYRKPGKFVTFTVGQLANITWQQGLLQYTAEAATTSNFHWYDDHLDFALRTNSVVNNWVEFRTPLLVKGKYKVWFNYRVGAHGVYTQVTFDGTPLSRIVDFSASLPSTTSTDAVLESQGFKRYSSTSPASNNKQVGQLAGVIDVTTTDRHRIRLTCIKDASSGSGPTATGTVSGGSVTLDFIQFIPVDAPTQIRPLFARDGSIVQ